MKRVKVVADSACDLPAPLLAKWDIHVVPLHVTVNGQDVSHLYTDPDAFWRLVEETGGRPTTAAPSPEQVKAVIEPLVEAGYEVVAIPLSAQLSTTYASFVQAAADYPQQVHVFDSASLSLGIGIQVLEAARLAAEGSSSADILAHLATVRERVHLLAVLDTIEWADRGGRIAYLMPVIRRVARVFNVKVILDVKGKVHFLGAQRSYRAALRVLKEKALALGPAHHLLVPHTRQHALAESLADELAPALGVPREEVIVHEAGPILGAHVGPRAVGVVVHRR